MSAQEVIRQARKHIGYVEGANKDNIFGEWYGANHSPWCAAFVSYALAHAHHKDLIAGAQTKQGFNSCGAGIKFFKAKKAWFKTSEAKVGDLAFFDWDHDGSQDHVGIVTQVGTGKMAGKIKCIEGNTSNASHSNGGVVQEQWRNASVIMGVGRPAYPVEAKKPAKATTTQKPEVKPATSVLTKEQILAFQVKKGLPQTGILDEATKARMSK